MVLTVTDSKNEKSSRELEIRAGNEAPIVQLELLRGNQYFYFPGQTVSYSVSVSDREDGSLSRGQIHPEQVSVMIDSMSEGYDVVHIAQGHKTADASAHFETGRILVEESEGSEWAPLSE